ncbi:hypothetical protein EDD11_009483 [Mortierella claussenii]|nr:hypothetical protein EDD11_009483 [Mortierella claussenii]
MSALVIFKLFPYVLIDFGYLTRPLWDKEEFQFEQVIVHSYAEGMSMEKRCEAHGWTVPSLTETSSLDPLDSSNIARKQTPVVFDAVIFSQELDMLEIRINELWDVVDKFLILESNATFTGLPKDEIFKLNRDRFAFAESKVVYRSVPLYSLKDGQNAWFNEGRMRNEMTEFISESGVQLGDLVISADVDEVVSRHTIELLKSCEGTPDFLHLRLRNYLYSYEFPVNDEGIARPSVRKWVPGQSHYVHGKSANVLLTDSGWHCSFCFRSIEEFRFKMQAYSHADRVRHGYMMEPTWIQQSICQGTDLFGMFPEVYSFRELFKRIGAIPKSVSAVDLPRYVLDNAQRFKFLLPGGCQRGGPFPV